MDYDPKTDPASPLTLTERCGPAPTPPVAPYMVKIEASARLTMDRPCQHCDAKVEIVSTFANGLPRIIGVQHERDCPNYTE